MNKRQESALARRVARERFLKARIVEREFGHHLVGVGREVGRIVNGFIRAGKIDDYDALRRSLSHYSEAIRPWAEAVILRMQAQVGRRDLSAWRELSRSIGSNLHREVERTPTGKLFRDLMDEQVVLITSLPAEAATRVHKLTRELMVQGRRASEIEEEIRNSGPVTQSRARVIARTEVARTASLLTQARAVHVGSEGYIWRTVGDSDVRPALNLPSSQRARFVGSHRKLEGKFIPWDDPPVSGQRGERAHAGQIYNCRCFSGNTLFDASAATTIHRSNYVGDLYNIRIGSATFEATPNHPVLTDRGWVAVGELQRGDHLVQSITNPRDVIERDSDQAHIRFEDAFSAASSIGIVSHAGLANFYGRIPDGEVDSVSPNSELLADFIAALSQGAGNLRFAVSNIERAALDSLLLQSFLDGPSVHVESLSDSLFAHSVFVETDDLADGQGLPSVSGTDRGSPMRYPASNGPDSFAEVVRINAKSGRGIFEHGTGLYKFLPLEDNFLRKFSFSGHVYTSVTNQGWYDVSALNIIAKNCWPEPVIKDF